MRFLIALGVGLSAVLSCSISSAQTLEDVLFLKNGSIIRGQLVNYTFDADLYSIKMGDGSVHSFSKNSISKILKEPSTTVPDTPKYTAARHSKPLPPHLLISPPPISEPLLPAITHDLSIGNLWHSVYEPYENNDEDLTQVARYNGVKLHYQQTHTKYLASRYGFEYATLDRIELTSNDEVIGTINHVDRDRYTGLIVTAIASTNLQRGWRAYVGAGLYNHHYFNENSKDRNYLGTRFEFGGGYMWQALSLTLQYNWHSRGQYPSDTDTIFSGGFNLSMGF